MPRILALLVCAVLCAAATPALAQTPTPSPLPPAPDRVTFTGRGSAHGLGMAMDGVEGEARAGWSHDKILSLFYPGTSSSHAYGTIRVGLAEGGAQHVSLPSGGTVAGLPVGSGGGVTVRPATGGKLALRFDAVPVAPRPTPTAKPKPTATPHHANLFSPVGVVPSPPLPTPAPKAPRKTPAPSPTTPAPVAGAATVYVPSPVVITPRGTPAVAGLDATGRRYRGTIELRRFDGGVRAINRVGLEDYVAGIAEEKGAGWPPEAMKALAVAARTLGVATMTWLQTHHNDGYDICPTDQCQVYFGYDGEESIMRDAASATAGEIRTYNGSAILAMYHGNGGGQTQSYKDLTNDKSDSYPYLASVKYPYADPWNWRVDTTLHDIADALKKDGVASLPEPLKYVIVLKRGETPRVKRVALFGNTTHGIAVTGLGFAHALHLPSNWFYVHLPHRPPRSIDAAFVGLIDAPSSNDPVGTHHGVPWALRILAGALTVAAATSNWSAHGGAAGAWRRLRGFLKLPRRVATRAAADASPG